MSVESLAIVLNHSQASGTDKLVLVGIANHDGDGGAWPSVATLAKYANVQQRAVNKSLIKLRELGEVIVYLQAGGNRNTADHMRPNRYEVLVRCPDDCDRTSQHRVPKKAVDKPLPAPVSPVDNTLFDPLSHRTPPVPQDTPPPVPQDTPPPVPQDTRTILTNHPGNPSLEPDSPAEQKTCRACGQPNRNAGKFCQHCINRGMDTEIINCRHCALTTRRQYHGQMWFYCTEHRHLTGQDQ